MRFKAIFAALALIAAPVGFAPAPAYADGIERPPQPQPRPRPRPRPRAPAPIPPPPVVQQETRVERETVTLSQSFFASSGGVGADIGTGYVGGSTVIIQGSSASASAFAFASASARAGGRFGGGRRGGGHGCACR